MPLRHIGSEWRDLGRVARLHASLTGMVLTAREHNAEQLLAQPIGDAAGGIGGGKAVKGADIGNRIAGAIGGGQLLGGLLGSGAAAVGGLDIASMASNLVGGGVAGLVFQVVLGTVMKKTRG